MFNALKYSQELEKAGFTRDQAEASVRLLIDVMNDEFATKSDFKSLETTVHTVKRELEESTQTLKAEVRDVKNDIKNLIQRREFDATVQELRKDMASGFREVEYRLTIKLGVFATIVVGVLGTLMKLIQTNQL